MKRARNRLMLGAVLLAFGAVVALLFVQARERQRAAEAQIAAQRAADEARSRAQPRVRVQAPPAEPRGETAAREPERAAIEVPALELSVVDPEGSPVAEAKIVVHRAGAVLSDGATGADGIARLRPLEGRAEYVIAVPGWELARGELELGSGHLTIALREDAEIEGVARVEGQPPAEPFELQWSSDAESGAPALPPAVAQLLTDLSSKLAFARVRTSADGSFRLRGLRAGTPGKLSWSAPYFLADAKHEHQGRELLLDPPRTDLDLDLVEGCELRLRVVDPAGAPVPRANVQLQRDLKETSGLTGSGRGGTADDEGRWRVALLPDPLETISVSVTAAGSSAAKRHDLVRPAVLRGVWDVGDLETLATRTLTVIVQDPEGRPISGAEAYPWPVAKNRKPELSGADGRIPVAIGLDGRQAAAEALGFSGAVVAVPAGASEVTITLERVCMLEFAPEGEVGSREGLAVELFAQGRMFAAEHELLPGGDPSVRPLTPRAEPGSLFTIGIGETSVALRPRRSSGLRVACLRPGEPLQAKLIGGTEVLCTVEVAPLRAGEHRTVPMRIERAGRSLLVRVLSPSMQPVGGAKIHTLGGDRQPVWSGNRANEQGELELRALFGEHCVFFVNAEPHAPKRVVLQPIPESPYEVVLESGTELEVELVDPGGSPYTGALEFSLNIGPGRLRQSTLGPGKYRLFGLPGGDVLLELHGDFVQLVRLRRASEANLRIVVGESGSIYGMVKGNPDPRDDGWMVSVTPTGTTREIARSAIHFGETGEAFCVVNGLAAGRYEVGFVRRSDPASDEWTRVGVTISVDVGGSPQTRIELELPR